MAPSAAEARPRFAALIHLLAPAPGRLEFAARVALICALSTLVTELYQTPEPALTIYIVFFMNKPDRMTSIVLCVAQTLLVTLVLVFVLGVATQVVDSPASRVAAMAAISVGLLFVSTASKLRPVGGILTLIVVYALALLGVVPAGEFATRGLLYAWLFVGIPAALSIAVNLLLAPAPRQLVQRALAARLHVAAAALRTLDADTLARVRELLAGGDESLHALLKMAALERTSPRDDLAALGRAVASSANVLLIVRFMRETGGALPSESLRREAACTLDEMADILAAGGYPVRIALTAADPRLGALSAALARFAEDPEEIAPATPPAEVHAGFMAADAFSNPEHLRYALKTTAAAMFCYLLYSVLDWPGIHTCLITCYIVSLTTVAESVEKLTLRIVGCLAGAALGLAVMLFVIPSYTSIAALVVIVFLGAMVSAWIAAGSPRIAYAGFQLAFAFFLSVVQGSAPAFDMTVARDRVIGILIGNLAMFAVATLFWPVSLKPRFEAGLAGVMRLLGQSTQEGESSTRRQRGAQLRTALAGVRDDLDLMRHEPDSVRPDARWLDEQRALTERVEALVGPLVVAAEVNAPLDARFQRSFEVLLRPHEDAAHAT
jgi:multidrug resistance protein MdtO